MSWTRAFRTLPKWPSSWPNRCPELKVATAHGQMAAGELDDVMNAFYDGRYDVLLSTTIVESGLDIPSANTLNRAPRGHVRAGPALPAARAGRPRFQAARLCAVHPCRPKRSLTTLAEKRLKVAAVARHAGRRLPAGQPTISICAARAICSARNSSGHIKKEVGFELYQQMLEEAVAEMKGSGAAVDEAWSPQIAVGTSVMIPENYVPDLQLRLGLYRRLGDLQSPQEIDAFGAELIDRFGPLPEEVDHLMKIVFIKSLCRTANVEKLDAGPKGLVVSFRHKSFPDPAGLVGFIAQQGSLAKIRTDQSVFFSRDWPTPEKAAEGGRGGDDATGEAGRRVGQPSSFQAPLRFAPQDEGGGGRCCTSRAAGGGAPAQA